MTSTPFRRDRRRLLFWAGAGLAGAALGHLPAGAAAPTRGRYETLDLDWADAARQRPVPVRLYLPEADAPVPLVVFSHGMGGARHGYSWFGRHLAAHGIASVHPQHVGSDRTLWGGNLFEMASRLRDAASEREALARVQDLRFVLDTLLEGTLKARFDAGRIVAAGHSYGANTTLLAAGARVLRDGRPVALRDERLRAAIVMSAPPFHGEGDPKAILGGIALPSLHVTCTEDVIRIPGYYSDAADRIAVYEAVGSTAAGAAGAAAGTGSAAGVPKWLAVYEGGSHSMFTDRSTTGGALLNPQVKSATQELALAFLQRVFDGRDAELAAWPQRHASILARFDAAKSPALA